MDSEQKVEVQCEKCGEDIYILAESFDYATINNQPIICEECMVEIEKSLRESELQQIRKFEYFAKCVDMNDMNKLGLDGWELVTIDNGRSFFKRELL